MLGQRRVAASILALVILLGGVGCGLETQRTTISGMILGEPTSPLSGGVQPVPLAAAVACNGVSVTASAIGRYGLSLVPASSYVCRVYADHYQPSSVTIPGSAGTRIQLNLGTTLHAAHANCQPRSQDVECPALTLLRAIITGVVRYQGTRDPVANAFVQCTPSGAQHAFAEDADERAGGGASTASNGSYSLSLIAPGQYGCIAMGPDRRGAMQQVTVELRHSVTVNFNLCQQHCPPVHYHLGPVMHNYTAYLIFWQPRGVVFEPGGSDARFKSLIQRYFHDVGGTPFFGLLSQYWDAQGAVENRSTLGGMWVDTTPYRHCDLTGSNCHRAGATASDPLRGTDIEAEIRRALQHNATWRTGLNREFFVLTGYGAEECSDPDNSFCSFNHNKHGFCGYHTAAGASGSTKSLIYAYIPDQANDGYYCSGFGWLSPHGDDIADWTIDVISHEQFESITDPIPYHNAGWYDDSSKEGNGASTEISDKCVDEFGAIGPDGGNITLHGERYLLQAEWSNRANRCVFS
ncbi:MAG TPA: carboxypeptidase-like regulatory domain-containing protein [Ktedonobacterales bacterium]|nr:carboxypeptidase-like regulatory domain-containing protein [Ktedonobacterales bacterium]